MVKHTNTSGKRYARYFGVLLLFRVTDDTVEIGGLKRRLLSTIPNCLRHFVPEDAVQLPFRNVREYFF